MASGSGGSGAGFTASGHCGRQLCRQPAGPRNLRRHMACRFQRRRQRV